MGRVVLTTALALSLGYSAGAQVAPDARLRIVSPDGQIVFLLSDADATHQLDPTSHDLRYSVDFHGKWLMDESLLGLKLAGEPPLGPGMNRVHVVLTAHAHDNFAQVEFADGAGRRLALEVHASNTGIAFRYIVPEQQGRRRVVIESERTQFRYNEDAVIYPRFAKDQPAVRAVPCAARPISQLSGDGLLTLPLSGQVPGAGWVSVSEAGAGAADAYVRKDAGALGTHIELVPAARKHGHATGEHLPFVGRWRLLMIADSPGQLTAPEIADGLRPASGLDGPGWTPACMPVPAL